MCANSRSVSNTYFISTFSHNDYGASGELAYAHMLASFLALFSTFIAPKIVAESTDALSQQPLCYE